MAKAGQIADRGVRNIESKFAKMNPRLPSGFAKGIGAVFAGVAIEQFVRAGRQAIATLADMADEAQRIGASTTFLQQFSYAVQMAGGTSDEASSALERFSREMSKAGAGGGELAKVFEANGVAIRDAQGNLLSIQAALGQYANLIQNAANEQDALNLAATAFGRGAGPAIVNALRDGAAGLATMADEASKAGAVIEEDVIRRAAVMDDRFTALEISASNWAKTMAVAIADFALPQLDELIKKVSTVLNLLGTDVSTYFSDPTKATGNAMLKAGDGTKLGNASEFYDALGFAERLSVTVNKSPTKIPRAGGGGGGGRRGGGGGGGGSRDNSAEVIADLELELQKVQAVGAARDEIITKEKILQELRHANVDAISAEGQKIEELVKAIDAAAKEQEQVLQAMQDFRSVADAGLGSLVDDLMNGVDAAEALQNSLQNMLSTIAQIAQKQLLDSLFGGGAAGGGGLGALIGGLFGGARAGGGPISAGRPYLVGEKGPELVVPESAGYVVPNGALGRSGGEANITINNMSGGAVSTEQRTTANGGREWLITIDRAVEASIGTPGKGGNRAVRQMGGRQQLTRR